MMTKSLLAAAAAVISSAAFAADLPSKKAPILPPPPPPPAWTGFYLGLNAGYGWSASRDSVFGYSDAVGDGFGALVRGGALPGSVSLSNDAFIGGGQLGYNYQFNANFVAGVEADIQGVATNTATAGYAAGGAYVQATRSLDYLGTVRGRLGYAVVPSLFVYATGGLAYGQSEPVLLRAGAGADAVHGDLVRGYAGRLDSGRRRRMAVLSELGRQARISLL